MRKKYIPAIIVCVILIIMVITNPGKESFRTFLVKQLTNHKFTEKDLGDNLKCDQTSNFFVFSNYNFTIKDYGVTMQGKYLGIFGFFFSVDGYSADGTE
jgi:hypothetical protein